MITTWAEFITYTDIEKEYLVEIEASKLLTGWVHDPVYTNCWYVSFTGERFGRKVIINQPYVSKVKAVLSTDSAYYFSALTIDQCNSSNRYYYLDWTNQRLYINPWMGTDPNTGLVLAFFELFFSTSGKTFWNSAGWVYYAPLLSGIPSFSVQTQEFIFGDSIISHGNIVLNNSKNSDYDDLGAFDSIFHNYQWINRQVIIYAGGADLPYYEYKRVWLGIITEVEKTEMEFTLYVSDLQERLQMDAVTETYSASDYPNIESGAVGKLIPMAFGVCKNVRPTQIDTTIWKFKISGHRLIAIDEVREDGRPISAGSISKNLANGEFTLSSYAGGVVTCDIQGMAGGDDGTCDKYSEIFLYLCQIAGISDYVYTGEVQQVDVERPYTLGIYIDQKIKINEILSLMDNSVLAWHGCTRQGYLTAQPWKLPDAGTPDNLYTATNIMRPRERITRDNMYYEIKVGYQKNWTIQADTATKVSDSQQNWSHDYLWSSTTNPLVKNVYDYQKTLKIETLLTSVYDADAVGAIIQELTASPWCIMEFIAKLIPLDTELGETIGISRERTILPDGRTDNYKIFDYREDHSKTRITVGAFKPL